MAKKQILLIEDHPDEKFGDKSLKEWIDNLFSDEYEIILETNPDNVLKVIKNHLNIEVVLLDIYFENKNLSMKPIPKGIEIANMLKVFNENIRIVVLTFERKAGKKIEFGQKDNVWYYFLKEDLVNPIKRIYFENLVKCLIEDPYNKHWKLIFPESNDPILKLENEKKNISKTILLKEEYYELIKFLSKQPYECINYEDIIDRNVYVNFNLNKAVFEINDYIRKSFDYNICKLIDSKGCPRNMVKIYIGFVENIEEKKDKEIDILTLSNRIDKLEASINEIKKILEKEKGLKI